MARWQPTAILYGDNNNWFAAYALWMIKYYGHSQRAKEIISLHNVS